MAKNTLNELVPYRQDLFSVLRSSFILIEAGVVRQKWVQQDEGILVMHFFMRINCIYAGFFRLRVGQVRRAARHAKRGAALQHDKVTYRQNTMKFCGNKKAAKIVY